MGEPFWRLEWLDVNGQLKHAVILHGQSPEVTIPVTWANPVIAWPFWHEHDLIPGQFMPAGALFPHDTAGKKLILSWEAGADAVFYRELAFAYEGNTARLPAYFDWLRFRELFADGTLSEAVRQDPWLVDWRSLAERTVNSGFDRRRLTPEPVISKPIPVPSGTWYGTSPFAEPLIFAEGETPVFPVRSGINIWISSEGILRSTPETWILQN